MRATRLTLSSLRSSISFVAFGCALAAAAASACGESRRPIGEECLRDEDCLSSVCAARTCVSAPALVTGASNPPGEEGPRIPDDASSSGGAEDAKTEGG